MKHRKSDILWKVVIEEVFADLLRFIYPDADQKYAMERGFYRIRDHYPGKKIAAVAIFTMSSLINPKQTVILITRLSSPINTMI